MGLLGGLLSEDYGACFGGRSAHAMQDSAAMLWPSVITAVATLAGVFGTLLLTERSTRARRRGDRADAERAVHRAALVALFVAGSEPCLACMQVAQGASDEMSPGFLARHPDFLDRMGMTIVGLNRAVISTEVLALPAQVVNAVLGVRTAANSMPEVPESNGPAASAAMRASTATFGTALAVLRDITRETYSTTRYDIPETSEHSSS